MKKRHILSSKLTKLLLVLSISIVCLMIGSLVVYAAKTAQDEKINDFQIGDVVTAIDEDFTSTGEISKGETINKEVRFKNTGTINQFVRVMIQPEIIGETIGGADDQVLSTKIGEDLLLDIQTLSWQDGKDGYYYYLQELKPGEVSKELFTTVKLSPSLDDKYLTAKFNIMIKVEVSNCAPFAYRDAWWEGVTPTSGARKIIDDTLKVRVD